MEKPRLNKRIFWDTDFHKIDYDKSYQSVIERVFERGDVSDIREIRRYYGDEVIKNVLCRSKYLSKIKLFLASAIFELPLQNFKCYSSKQSTQELWPF